MAKMTRLVDIVKGIGKFELGINELMAIARDRSLTSLTQNGIDLLFRYSLFAGEMYGMLTANSRSGFEDLELLARAEAGKLAVHYFIKGMNYFNELVMAYNRKQQKNSQHTTLDLH